jgi:hypothetical protein
MLKFFFFLILGFELSFTLARQVLYHLEPYTQPFLLCFQISVSQVASCVEVLIHRISQNVTVFEDEVFKNIIKLKWGHYSGFWSNLTGVLIRRGD